MTRLLLFLFIVSVKFSLSQAQRGTLSGKVLNQYTDQAIPFAQVILSKKDSIYYFTQTNEVGEYLFKKIVADTFECANYPD